MSEEKLGSLKCVLKCLEDHKLDPVKSLPGWEIHEMIKNLENDIVELGKRMEDNASMKRKTDEASTQKYPSQETKRSKGGFPVTSYPPVNGLLEQNAAATLFDGAGVDQFGNYQMSSSLHGSSLVETAVLPADMDISISNAGMDSSNEMGQTRELAFKDISVGQSFIQQAMPTTLTTPTPPPPVVSHSAVEGGFVDLYHFGDAVVLENDAPKSSSTETSTLPHVRLSSHPRPPYFYN